MEVFSEKMFLLGNDNIRDEVALQLEKETPVLERQEWGKSQFHVIHRADLINKAAIHLIALPV